MTEYDRIRIIRSAVGSLPSWGLITELQNSGFDVIGIDSSPLSFGLYLLKTGYVVPKGAEPHFMRELIKIIDRESPQAILSGPEEELLVLSKNRDLIEERGVTLLCPNHESVKICANKERMHEYFVKEKIPTPKVFDNEDSVEFPCIIKPVFGRGSSNVFVATDVEDLTYCKKKVQTPLIQEFIPGNEFTVDVLADERGRPLSIVPRLRLSTESGVSVKAKTIYDAEVIKFSKKIAKGLKLFGPSCIQCIKNEEGIKFIEVNPRFGGGAILSIKADPYIIPNLTKIIRGELTTPNKTFVEGLVMMRYHSEVFISDHELKKEPDYECCSL
jgi:carbamoyl-phosphate synthase large subunit